jgi:amidase
MAGSVLGIGTDLGGSLRTSPGYCGIYGFKPSHGRVPTGGAKCASRPICPAMYLLIRFSASFGGNESIRMVVGPFARSMVDLILASQVLFSGRDALGAVIPVPYRDVQLG